MVPNGSWQYGFGDAQVLVLTQHFGPPFATVLHSCGLLAVHWVVPVMVHDPAVFANALQLVGLQVLAWQV